jgi:hypothetical protein
MSAQAQIKSKVDGKCLKFSAESRGGQGLYMETCNMDPSHCVTSRCYYSQSLGDEEWYLADNGQMIASFVRGDGHQIPPLQAVATAKVAGTVSEYAGSFNGPVAGLGEVCGTRFGSTMGSDQAACDSADRCGQGERGGNDMGKTPMCVNTTSDGKLYIDLAEIESRCAADANCAGFAQDTKDGPPYFRPMSLINSIGADPKWTTWTKGPLPPSPAPPTPADWFNEVDVPFCLATANSSFPPKEPPAPPAISVPGCNSAAPTLLIFAGPLSGGAIVVGLSNVCAGNHTIAATFEQIGAATGSTYTVRDTINHVDLADATSTVSAIVGEHDIVVLKLTPK